MSTHAAPDNAPGVVAPSVVAPSEVVAADEPLPPISFQAIRMAAPQNAVPLAYAPPVQATSDFAAMTPPVSHEAQNVAAQNVAAQNAMQEKGGSFVSPVAPPLSAAPLAPLPVARTATPLVAANANNVVRPVTLSPLLSMLVGGVLACVLVALGMNLGARRSADGAALDPITAVGTDTSGVSARSGNAIVNAVKRVGPAVVNVDTTFGNARRDADVLPSPGEGSQPQQGKGTGVVIDTKRGLMLTNAHVVADAKKIQITTRDGDRYSGRIVGVDRVSDIAVVELSNKSLPQATLAPLKKNPLAIGEWAIAIGNPFAQANTVTVGVISAVGRSLNGPGRDGKMVQLTDMIQTDAAINPGNSGGPLCNIKGEVIGINTAIIPFGQGLGFTIPIYKAKNIADQLIAKGRAAHPYIGIEMKPISEDMQTSFGLKDRNGAFVARVSPKSPAAKAGLQQGDVIRRVDGRVIKDYEEVPRIIGEKKVGQTVKIEVLRNSAVKRTLNLKIGDRPNL